MSIKMVHQGVDEDYQSDADVPAPDHYQREAQHTQHNRRLATPQTRACRPSSNGSYKLPKALNNSSPTPGDGSDFDSSPSELPKSATFPPKSRKRGSDGKTKKMVAELNARTDLAISRANSVTPVDRRLGHTLPHPGSWGNDWDWEILRRYPSIMNSLQKSPRSPKSPGTPKTPGSLSSSDGGIKDSDKYRGKGDLAIRKDDGLESLLEWRNKDLFEEPLRI